MPGTILKKLCPQEEACFRLLMHDVLRPYVPEYKGVFDVRELEVSSGPIKFAAYWQGLL
jgi:1D-myo-inositol-triphosphate 3-kinase